MIDKGMKECMEEKVSGVEMKKGKASLILPCRMTANTHFQKRESHLVTFKSGHNRSQIDFLLTRK
jgi:hypothetical protein